MGIEPLISVVEITAIVVSAVSGLIEAVRKRMDLFGIFAVAFTTAFGGGTVRDVLLDRRPLFWVQHHEYVWLVVALTVIAPLLLRVVRHRLAQQVLQATDAVGLGLFSISGASLAQAAGMPLIVVLIMGIITGVFGGVMRDVLCNQIPVVFQDHYHYALCALCGCLGYCALCGAGVEPGPALLIGAAIVTGLRLLVLACDWRVPRWPNVFKD